MTTFSARTPAKTPAKTPRRRRPSVLEPRRPLAQAAINTNQVSRAAVSTCQVPAPEPSTAKPRRTRGVSKIQLEEDPFLSAVQPPEKRQKTEQNVDIEEIVLDFDPVAENDAIIYAQHWAFVRSPMAPPAPERSRMENKAVAMWLAAHLTEMLVANLALRWFVCEAVARDLEYTLDFFQPDNAVVFLALKYVEDILPRAKFDQHGRNDADCATMILRAFLSALSLSSKWLDDYSQPLHEWGSHMRLSKAVIAELELLALTTMDWTLSIEPPEWTSWLFGLQKRATIMNSSLLNWKSMEIVVELIGRSLSKLLATYTPEPFEPVSTRGDTSWVGGSTQKRQDACASFQKLLALDLGRFTTLQGSSHFRRSTVSVAPTLSASTSRMPSERNRVSRRSISTYRPLEDIHLPSRRSISTSHNALFTTSVEHTGSAILERGANDARSDRNNTAIHRWRESVAHWPHADQPVA
ncbi:hypothetical protein PQX77_009584 [Marasmius sp. AFHP31]|nr:hypothetical protein PQX77_009584 [Marasmius sp. AFHP31]